MARRVLPWIAILIFPLMLQPQSRTQSQRELEKIRKRLTQVRGEIADLRKQEKGIVVEIDLLEEQVKLTRRLIRELRTSQTAIQGEIDSLQTSIDSLTVELDESKDNLRSRLVSLYKRGQFYELEVVMGAGSVAEVYDRIYFTRYAARAEDRMFDQLLAAKTDLEISEDSLLIYSSELHALIAENNAAQDSLNSAKRQKERKLNQVKTSRQSKQKLQTELEARRRELEKILASMEQQSKTSPGRKPTGTVIEKGRGNLPWPVDSRKLVASFGTITHPRYGTKTENDGIDIDCSGGKTVKAVNKGKVAYAEFLTGYGLLVLIDHQDGYYTLYGNLDRISVKKGQAVVQGQALGYASDYLHFSLTRGSDFRNPIDYLK